jgi:hypothetical protein
VDDLRVTFRRSGDVEVNGQKVGSYRVRRNYTAPFIFTSSDGTTASASMRKGLVAPIRAAWYRANRDRIHRKGIADFR